MFQTFTLIDYQKKIQKLESDYKGNDKILNENIKLFRT